MFCRYLIIVIAILGFYCRPSFGGEVGPEVENLVSEGDTPRATTGDAEIMLGMTPPTTTVGKAYFEKELAGLRGDVERLTAENKRLKSQSEAHILLHVISIILFAVLLIVIADLISSRKRMRNIIPDALWRSREHLL